LQPAADRQHLRQRRAPSQLVWRELPGKLQQCEGIAAGLADDARGDPGVENPGDGPGKQCAGGRRLKAAKVAGGQSIQCRQRRRGLAGAE